MRVLLDHELITLREAQRLLNVNRNTIDEMIATGVLTTIKIGTQIKVEGKCLKALLSPTDRANSSFKSVEDDIFLQKASQHELEMISDWT